MRNKRVFIFIGILILSMLCVYTLVHTVPATLPVVQEEAEAHPAVKAEACRCCKRVNRARERVRERLRKEWAAAESAVTAEESSAAP